MAATRAAYACSRAARSRVRPDVTGRARRRGGDQHVEQTVTRQQVTFGLVLAYLWVLMIFFGAIVFETVVVYPDIFHDVPRSFDAALAFMVVRSPSSFFPPVGALALLLGVAASIASWRVASARPWIVGSLVIMVAGEFLLSAVYFWPRNTIMFVEGAAVHSVAFLQQIAHEFQTGHWLRVALSAAASVSSFVGFLKFYRHRIVAQAMLHET
jgi:hypothetical protein